EPARVHGFVIPHDDASAAPPLHRLHRVDRQLADELVRRAVPPQPFEEERHVADSQLEGGGGGAWWRFRTCRHDDSCAAQLRGLFGFFYPGTRRECVRAAAAAARGAGFRTGPGLTSPGAVPTVSSGSILTDPLD